MSKLKGVIIGAGYFSQFHVDAWKRMQNVEITAVCDHHAERANQLAQQFSISRSYTDTDEMLEKERPDFVDIITPPTSRMALLQVVMKYNVHIICQKPLANTIEEVHALKALIDSSKIRFMVHENWRFQPWYRKIKTLINQGIVGDRLFHLSFKMRMGDAWGANAFLDRQPYFRTMPRLLIHETGVHFVDTFRFLAGEIEGVYAQLKTHNPILEGEDAGLVILHFASGATGILDANRYNEPDYNNPRYTFGEMVVEGNAGSLWLKADGSITSKSLGEKFVQHDFNPPTIGFCGDSVLACQQHFINSLMLQLPFETSLDEYMKTLEVVEGIYHSHLTKRKIDLESQLLPEKS